MNQLQGCRVLAADGGMVHAQTLGAEVELWVGDFDSASAQLQARYPHTPRQTVPTDKNFTDGELAIQAALGRGATQLILVGAMGGQTDHSLSHVLLAIKLAREGIGVLLTTGLEEAYPLLPGQTQLKLPQSSKFSILPFSSLLGLSIQGVQWPLENARVALGNTWTLSNRTLGMVTIGLRRGYGVVVAYPATL